MLDLGGNTEVLTSGLWTLVKGFILYLALPIIICSLIVGKILRLRGKMYSFIMSILIAICALAFLYKGLPHILDQINSQGND